METKQDGQEQQAPRPAMVQPGERAVLFSHRQYRQARQMGRGLEDYDVLMRRPDDAGSEDGEPSEDERWVPVRAKKYLKHRAMGWHEAASLEELPKLRREEALDRDAFGSTGERAREGGADGAS